MRIRDIMLSTVPQVSATASVDRALDQLRIAGEPSLIVMDQKRVVGVVSEGDLQSAPESQRHQLRVRGLMHPVDVLSPDATIKDAANYLRSRNVERVPVVEDDHLTGVVTVGALLELIGRGAVHAPPNRERVVLAKRGTKRGRQRRPAAEG